MSTWTSSRVYAGLVLLALAAACAETGADAARPNTALASADLGGGAVRLVPPGGFCIDRRGLRQDFAILARCDTLGAPVGGQGAPLGIITVTLTESPGAFALGDAAALAGPDARLLDAQRRGDLSLVHLAGPTPPGTDARHWKAVVPVGMYVLGLTAYGPDGGALASREGGPLLAVLAARTRAATEARDVADAPPVPAASATPPGSSFD